VRHLERCCSNVRYSSFHRDQKICCAQQMVAGVTAQYSTLPGHLSPVTIVDHGTFIINDARVTIIDDLGLKQEISGSYLVTYSSKVLLNINQLGTSRKKPAVSAMTLVNITAHQNRLSLPFLHELSLRNLHHIGTHIKKCTMGSFLSYSFALLASFLLCSTDWLGYHVLRTRGTATTQKREELARPFLMSRICHIRWPTRAVRKLPNPHLGCHRPIA